MELLLLILLVLYKLTFQDDIFLTVLRAKDIAACMGENFINREKAGEDVECCEMKLILLVKWIGISESYYCQNFSVNGNITPDLPCLTLAQMQELLAKIKVLIGV